VRVVVTGGAGFIGSNLVDALLADGHDVVAVDDLSTGDVRFLEAAQRESRFQLVELDVSVAADELVDVATGADAVVHLAANADVRFGWNDPGRDLRHNTVGTHHVLEAARLGGVARLLFSSTGSVYGETRVVPTPEDCPFPVQTSLYGASKLAAEGMVAAYAEGAGLSATVFRFVSVLGHRYTHGHVVDFVRQLREHPDRLTILGDGSQRKSYLDVGDCVRALQHRLVADPGFEVLNLGVDDTCTVRESAGWICDRLGLAPELEFTGGKRGWVGDNPFIWLDTSRVRATGWAPSRGIREAVEGTVDYLVANPWVCDRVEARA
jgi:UDP-glucose 4-epimerase